MDRRSRRATNPVSLTLSGHRLRPAPLGRARGPSSLEARPGADGPGEGRVVVIAMALGDEPVLDLGREARDRQGSPNLLGQVEGDGEILAMERQPEADGV